MSQPTLHHPRIDPRTGNLPRETRHDLLRVAAVAAVIVGGALLAAQAMAASPAARPPAGTASAAAGECPSTLDVTFPRLQDEAPQNLCQYAGKVLLVVNTASYCGFTRQYEGLESVYAKYRQRGLVVLAFPSNDFGQEAADTGKIADLCFNTYGVKFPIFQQSVVSGNRANPLFKSLISTTGQSPAWNFHKYLIDRTGRPVAAFPSKVEPDDPRLLKEIERLLARPTT